VPGRRLTKYCMVAPSICGPSAWNLRHVFPLAFRIFRWLLDVWKIEGNLTSTVVLSDVTNFGYRPSLENIKSYAFVAVVRVSIARNFIYFNYGY
jgi:hypothetical protein